MVDQTIFRQALGLFSETAIEDARQRFATQLQACFGNQAPVEPVGRKGLVEQALEVGIQAVLDPVITRVQA